MEPNYLSPIRNSPPPVHIHSYINPVHASPTHFFKIHFNITPCVSLRLPNGLFPSGFRTNTFSFLSDLPRAPSVSFFLIC
jgi:hypothetical protein